MVLCRPVPPLLEIVQTPEGVPAAAVSENGASGARRIASCAFVRRRAPFVVQMTGSSTRRGLLHLLAGQIPGAERLTSAATAARLPVAMPTSRRATADDLRTLAVEAGLGSRLEVVGQAARRSVRLEVMTNMPGVGPPPPQWGAGGRGAVLRFPGRSVPGASSAPTILDVVVDAERHGAVTAVIEDGTTREDQAGCWGSEAPRGFALRASREVVLPRAWSAVMEPFDLDSAEQQSWQELRHRLADWQGVIVGDETEPGTILHRLGGFPDERNGDMPLLCELLDRGIDVAGEPPRTHSSAAAVDADGRWRRWRLLLQLSADDRLGWSWGGESRRAYVWIDESDLRAGRFDRVRPLVQ
jgi:hypothetical protein